MVALIGVSSLTSNLTPSSESQASYSQQQAEAEIRVRATVEKQRRARWGSSFKNFVGRARPTFQWYRHCDELGNALECVCNGTIKRLMVFLPVRHGKSEQASRLYPAYHLFKHPDHQVGITSYGAELAYGLSRDARDNYLSTGRKLNPSAEGMVEWHTSAGGRCWSAGVGGAITGRGGDVLIVDDPFSNAEEAYSQHQRDKVWEWYQHVFYTRLHPNGAIIIILTRWHEDDLAGRLLNAEKNAESPERWVILNFPAIKEPNLKEFPPSCTVVPDWRQEGEALCPERYDVETLLHTKERVGDRAWRALFQQSPVEEGGNLWKLSWFKPYDDTIFRQNGHSVLFSGDGCDWDMNDGGDRHDGENAACAFVRSALGHDGNIYVSDCDFKWLGFPEQVDWMKSIVSPHYVEAKSSGRSAVTSLVKSGVYAAEVKVKGIDKTSRAILATPIAEQGKVFIHRKIWDKLLFDERQGILGFPARPFKDLNDAFVQAINRHWVHSGLPEPARVKVEPKDMDAMTSGEYMQSIYDRKLRDARRQRA